MTIQYQITIINLKENMFLVYFVRHYSSILINLLLQFEVSIDIPKYNTPLFGKGQEATLVDLLHKFQHDF